MGKLGKIFFITFSAREEIDIWVASSFPIEVETYDVTSKASFRRTYT